MFKLSLVLPNELIELKNAFAITTSMLEIDFLQLFFNGSKSTKFFDADNFSASV